MHHVAEYGIAAHWKYKETGNSNTKVNAEDEKFGGNLLSIHIMDITIELGSDDHDK